MPDLTCNQLYFGDNLEILRDHIADASIDLSYLGPPFNSNATYNILFQERSGRDSATRITAFDDTWSWDEGSELALVDMVKTAPTVVRKLLESKLDLLGRNDMMAYLTMMTQRMIELRRVLKPTGSIYRYS